MNVLSYLILSYLLMLCKRTFELTITFKFRPV